jgi:DNA polymerase/3'-5' exonuclease PolX
MRSIEITKVKEGYKVPSSSNDNSYLVKIIEGNVANCNCIGYKYYNNCKHVKAVKELLESKNNRIPRRFCEGIVDYFKYNYFLPNSIDYCVAGSYRRMLPDSKDLDIVISGNSSEIKSSLLSFLKENFPNGNKKKETDINSRSIGNYIIQWYVPVTPDRDILMDFHLVNPDDFESEVLFFTGSMEFNIKMRAIAKKKGYKLNQYGLWKNEKCLTKKEKEIFNILGMDYINPQDR